MNQATTAPLPRPRGPLDRLRYVAGKLRERPGELAISLAAASAIEDVTVQLARTRPRTSDLTMPLKHRSIVMPFVPIRDDGPSREGDPELVLPAGWLSEAQADRAKDWHRIARAFEDTPGTITAWRYLNHHPAFWWFDRRVGQPREVWFAEENLISDLGVERCVNMILVEINPATGRYDSDPALNTMTVFGWEVGHQGWKQVDWFRYRDDALNGTASSMDEAILRVGRLVHAHYGNDRRVVETDTR